jgi:hypothetical protein
MHPRLSLDDSTMFMMTVVIIRHGHHSTFSLVVGFRVVSVSSMQRQWWFEVVSGGLRAGGK